MHCSYGYDAKFSSEIATLKFLHDETLVRVPKLIGYGLGDDDIGIPFMITQNVSGLPLSIYWGRFGKMLLVWSVF